jgi:hypothetical protein
MAKRVEMADTQKVEEVAQVVVNLVHIKLTARKISDVPFNIGNKNLQSLALFIIITIIITIYLQVKTSMRIVAFSLRKHLSCESSLLTILIQIHMHFARYIRITLLFHVRLHLYVCMYICNTTIQILTQTQIQLHQARIWLPRESSRRFVRTPSAGEKFPRIFL